MTKCYSAPSEDLTNRIAAVRKKHYADLEKITVQALFVFDDESDEQILTHQGYPAAAVTKIVGLRDRAAGMADVLIVFDRSYYSSLDGLQMDALVDHELHHIERVVEDSNITKVDAIGRPKLKIRKHDRSFGWFDEVAARHGEASLEVQQAKALLRGDGGQIYFDFDAPRQGAAA